jgi:N-acetylglucosaminyl-diphospho-decaprenol L-rhamnosyltransferase
MGSADSAPAISVLLLNYNGAQWLPRCLDSLRCQTIFEQIEIIVVDNQSPDNSARLAEDLTKDWPNARVIQNGANLGFAEGNNRPAKTATGKYLFLLNNDTWLEPDCLEKLFQGIGANQAAAGCPLVLNYDDNSFQSMGAFGFDIFGLPTDRLNSSEAKPVLMPEGCAYFIERELFEKLGGLDREFFMFSEEYDLSWRLWIAGRKAVAVPSAILHHRGAAQVNPRGSAVEFRTSDTKRFYANRNALLSVLKNAKNLLLLMFLLQLGLLATEALVALLLIRRWSFIRRAYIDAIAGCWSARHHVRSERRRIRAFRKHGDLWMLRFLRLRPNRWDELMRIRKTGLPRVSADNNPAAKAG